MATATEEEKRQIAEIILRYLKTTEEYVQGNTVDVVVTLDGHFDLIAMADAIVRGLDYFEVT